MKLKNTKKEIEKIYGKVSIEAEETYNGKIIYHVFKLNEDGSQGRYLGDYTNKIYKWKLFHFNNRDNRKIISIKLPENENLTIYPQLINTKTGQVSIEANNNTLKIIKNPYKHNEIIGEILWFHFQQ